MVKILVKHDYKKGLPWKHKTKNL